METDHYCTKKSHILATQPSEHSHWKNIQYIFSKHSKGLQLISKKLPNSTRTTFTKKLPENDLPKIFKTKKKRTNKNTDVHQAVLTCYWCVLMGTIVWARCVYVYRVCLCVLCVCVCVCVCVRVSMCTDVWARKIYVHCVCMRGRGGRHFEKTARG